MYQPMRSVYDSLVNLLVSETDNETKYRPMITNPWATTPGRRRLQALQHWSCSKIFEMVVRQFAGVNLCPDLRSLHPYAGITVEAQLHFAASNFDYRDSELMPDASGCANHDRFP